MISNYLVRASKAEAAAARALLKKLEGFARKGRRQDRRREEDARIEGPQAAPSKEGVPAWRQEEVAALGSFESLRFISGVKGFCFHL